MGCGASVRLAEPTVGDSSAAQTALTSAPGELVRVERDGEFARVTMNVPERRNALSVDLMRRLLVAVREVGASDARGLLLAGEGPVFCAGHDFGDMVHADLQRMRELLALCAELMTTLQSIPQPVLARVHGLATAAGCQLVATADLAIASEEAAFAIPGGKGGWFCHTPLVAVARAVPRKRALEMAFTGDVIDARTAAAWGLVNAVVPATELDAACLDLLGRATRGSRNAKALGKQGFYTHVDLDQAQAYAYAIELMAATSQTRDAREHGGVGHPERGIGDVQEDVDGLTGARGHRVLTDTHHLRGLEPLAPMFVGPGRRRRSAGASSGAFRARIGSRVVQIGRPGPPRRSEWSRRHPRPSERRLGEPARGVVDESAIQIGGAPARSDRLVVGVQDPPRGADLLGARSEHLVRDRNLGRVDAPLAREPEQLGLERRLATSRGVAEVPIRAIDGLRSDGVGASCDLAHRPVPLVPGIGALDSSDPRLRDP